MTLYLPPPPPPPPITASRLRALAVSASADPRSVLRVLRGEHVRGMADDRIRAVLVREGLIVPQDRAA